jgi:hypothetical protein
MPLIIKKTPAKPVPDPKSTKLMQGLVNGGKVKLPLAPVPKVPVTALAVAKGAQKKLMQSTAPVEEATLTLEGLESMTLEDLRKLSPEKLADAYGMLKDQTDALSMNPLFQRYNEVAKVMGEYAHSLPVDEAQVITGDRWEVSIGLPTKAAPQITDMEKAANMLGAEVFWKLCTISITDLKKYLNPEQLAQVLQPDSEVGYIKKRKIETKFRG